MSSEQKSPVVPLPDHLHTVTPGLAAGDGARAIDFCREALGAQEVGVRFALTATPSPVIDQFYGARAGRLRDPHRQQWMMNQRIEHVSADEMARRAAASFGGSHRRRAPPLVVAVLTAFPAVVGREARTHVTKLTEPRRPLWMCTRR